jgi:CheY-like chemotaxis protein
MLEPLGYTVVTASDGLDGIHTFESSPDDFDIIITDYAMPYLSGLDLCKRIREIRTDIPIILVSGYLDAIPKVDIAEPQNTEFLKKPFSQTLLSAQIQSALGGVEQV